MSAGARAGTVAIVVAACVLAACGSDSGSPGAATGTDSSGVSKQAKAWVLAVNDQKNRFDSEAVAVSRALKRRDFVAAGAALDRMADQGRRIRARFGTDVPTDEITDADKIYTDLKATGDAAIAWDLAYAQDPPPFSTGSVQSRIRRGGRLADAATAFTAALVKLDRQTNAPSRK
jgi:hypothetical protein